MYFSPKDSAIFNQSAKQTKLQSSLSKINWGAKDGDDMVSSEEIEKNIPWMKRLNYGLRNDVLKYYAEGGIEVYLPKEVRIPEFSNILLSGEGKNALSSVILSRKNLNNGVISVPSLYGALQNATVTYFLENKGQVATTDAQLVMSGTVAYVELLIRVLDRLYGLSMSPKLDDIVRFEIAKFFLVNMNKREWETETKNIAFESTSKNVSIDDLIEFDNAFSYDNRDAFYNFFNFMKALSGIKALSKLTVRSVVNTYIRQYGESTLLALDYLPAFYRMLTSSYIESMSVNSLQINKNKKVANAISLLYSRIASLF